MWQDSWEGDRPYSDIETWNKLAEREDVLYESKNYYIEAQRCLNFLRRTFPHLVGWFPMVAAWTIIIVRTSPQTPQL